MCIAVTDGGGHLLAMVRMDRAPLLCIQIAQDKAYSVASFGGLPTSDWWRMLESEPALLHGIVKTDRLIIFGGGVPLVADGRTVGAIGVSGGSAEQDVRIAEAGAAALPERAPAGDRSERDPWARAAPGCARTDHRAGDRSIPGRACNGESVVVRSEHPR